MNCSRQICVHLETKGISHTFLLNKYFISALRTCKGSLGRQEDLVCREKTELALKLSIVTVCINLYIVCINSQSKMLHIILQCPFSQLLWFPELFQLVHECSTLVILAE